MLLPAWFEPVEYDLELHPNPTDARGKYRFEGSEVLSALVHEEGHRELTLHARELSVLEAAWTALGTDAELPAEGASYDHKEHSVTFKFAEPLPKGRGKLKLSFQATHNDQMAGFYRSEYDGASGQKATMVSTQFEALDARRCFVCVDEPAAKAVFKATLVLPDARLTALSNMPESEVSLLPDGRKRVSFLPSPRMSTYLLAFAVGEFDFVQARTQHGVMVRVFTPPGKASRGTFALDVAVKSLDLYDDYFAVPYPLPKLDMIAIPAFAMGAMCVASAPPSSPAPELTPPPPGRTGASSRTARWRCSSRPTRPRSRSSA